MFDLNKGWKPGKLYKQRKFDPNLMSVKVPFYQLNQFHGRVALIFNGRQVIPKKIPKNTDYFIDKHLGIFEINYERHFFMNKCELYFFDVRNQNAFDPTLMNKIYQWADQQGLYKIRRADVKHAIRLRSMKEQQKNNPLADLADQLNQEKRDTRRFIQKVIKRVEEENAHVEKQRELDQGDPNSDEYHIKDEDEQNEIIVKNLFDNGYIDENQKFNLEWKLRKKEIKETKDLINEVDSFTDLLVSQPIPHELERMLDDYHTYKPQNVVTYISWLHKIRNGINKLRTKAVINWFPATYLLFGALGVVIVLIMWSQYGGSFDPNSLIPGTGNP